MQHVRSGAAWFCVVAAVLLVGSSVGAEEVSSDVKERVEGVFRYAGGDQGQKRIEKAIDEAVDQMFFLIQGIARGKLEEVNPIPRTMEFKFPGPEKLGVRGNDDDFVITDIHGERWVDWELDGNDFKVKQQLKDGRIIQTFRGEDGWRTNTFVVSDDGQRMTMYVRLGSDKLEEPITYSLPFKRVK